MGTKLPSSNWSAEKIGKLLTSAGILYAHTNTRAHARMVTQGQSVQRSLGNMESSILSFIHLLFPSSSLTFSSIGPITAIREPQPLNSSGTSGVQLPWLWPSDRQEVCGGRHVASKTPDSKWRPIYFSVVAQTFGLPLEWAVHSRFTSQHASVSPMICLANQNDPRERLLQARQDAAKQSKLRHGSTYDLVRSRWE